MKRILVSLVAATIFLSGFIEIASAPPAEAGAAASIARFVLDKAASAIAGHGAGFIFDAIGNALFGSVDPNAEALAKLQTSVDAISNQLKDLQKSVEALNLDVLQADLNNQLQNLLDKTTSIQALYDTAFLPVVRQAIAFSDAKANGDASAITKARDALVKARDYFYFRFDLCCDNSQSYIHAFLVPGSVTTSILKAKGRVLLASHRYLTAEDSAQIRAVYDWFADYESLAAWMRMERFTPTEPGDTYATYDIVRQQYLDATIKESLNLPPVIPQNVVIDGGPGTPTTTNGKTMWLPSSGPNLRFNPGTTAESGSVPIVQAAMNSSRKAGFNDWQIPSQSTVTALINGFVSTPTAKTLNDFLSGLNAADPDWAAIATKSWPFVWSNDVISQTATCRFLRPFFFEYKVTKNVHTGVSSATSTPVWGGHPIATQTFEPPVFDTTYTPEPVVSAESYCDGYVSAGLAGAYPAALGGFLASRGTGVMSMDYMAQGNGPNIKAGANLRGADLSGLNLTGADLTGADLTGANLLDAVLSGAKLAGATLTGVRSGGIVGAPADLPSGWRLANGYLAGPGAVLAGADLKDANLAGANLAGADLTGVKSGGVDCTGCALPTGWIWTGLPSGFLIGPGVNLTGLDLSGADLTGVRSGGVDCTGCTLPTGWRWSGLPSGYLVGPGVVLTGANLTGTDLSGVNATGADLTRVSLVRANLTDANLTRANLTGANVSGSNMSGANLSGSTLTSVFSGGVNCTSCALPTHWLWSGLPSGYLVGPGANLTGANLQGTDLTDAFLTGATMNGADLRGATLTRVTSGGIFINVNPAAGLPTGWRVVKGFLVGPGAYLGGADLSGFSFNQTAVSLSGTDLTRANLTNDNLTNVDLSRSILTGATVTGVDFSTSNDNTLSGIISGSLVGTPKTLPASGRYRITQGYFVGPSANLTGSTFTPAAQLGISLSSTNFTDATLTGVNLTGAFLNNAILTGAKLTGATLSGVNMSNATLTGVTSGGIVGNPALPASWRVVKGYLVGPGANLAAGDLASADLSGVNLRYANLAGANLLLANLGNADVTGANLSRAVLQYTSLQRANFTRANLTTANLRGTTATDGVFIDTDLAGADLNGAWFASANMTGANFAGADLSGATFNYANLTDANLNARDLSFSKWLSTICPNGVTQSTRCSALPSTPPSSSIAAAANNSGTSLLVDINPDLGSGAWTFTVERLSGIWMTVGTYVTQNPRETQTINLPEGTYRVFTLTQHGYLGSTSAEVTLGK